MATSTVTPAPAGQVVEDAGLAPALPRWPLVALFAPLMLWWALGLVDVIWIVLAVPMLVHLAEAAATGRRVTVPRGFGVWLLFLAWMLASAIMVDTFNHAVEFAYRGGIYLACTVVFVYVYNARTTLTDRRVCGLLTTYWLWTVLGGFLGMLLPGAVLKTPAYYAIRLLSAEASDIGFVNVMVVRRFAQYNPDSYLGVAARPSAPFLYANNWGSAYSLLLPFVVAYVITTWGTRRARALVVLVPVSLVPAFLTLNRGMLIGLGISAAYVAGRLALRGRLAAVAVILVGSVVGGLVFDSLAAARLETRLQGSSTTTRASLYQQSLDLVPASPVFGYAVPVQTLDPDEPPIGTQGQFWMLLVSHGPVATGLFVGWFLIAWWLSRRRRDAVAMAAAAVLLVGVVELAFYGMVPYGLPILMVAAALGLRGRVPSLRSPGPAAARP